MELPGRVVATFHHGYPTVLGGAVLLANEIATQAALWTETIDG
jgi:dihydroorotase